MSIALVFSKQRRAWVAQRVK